MISGVEFQESKDIPKHALERLYGSVGWSAYTNDLEGLQRAIQNSSFVVTAWQDGELLGLARGISDDVSIFYLQDILVLPEHQRHGIGKVLLQRCLERYAHVMQKVLLTDEDAKQLRFYETLGYRNTRSLVRTKLNVFVQMSGIE